MHPLHVALRDALAGDSRLTLMCTYNPDDLVERFGSYRVVSMPIAESAMLGMATGLALTGTRVVVNVARAAFLLSAMDALANQATKWRYMTDGQYSVPLTIRGLTQGGEHLGAQHEHVPHGLFSQIPGLVVAVPSSPLVSAGMLRAALAHPDPVLILESPRLYAAGWPDIAEPVAVPDTLTFGEAVTVRPGRDVTLVGVGDAVRLCLEAAEVLACEGTSAEVVDVRTASPLDVAGIRVRVSATGAAVLVDYAHEGVSLMESLGFRLVRDGALAPDRIRLVAAEAIPRPFSPRLQTELEPGLRDVLRETRTVARRPGR